MKNLCVPIFSSLLILLFASAGPADAQDICVPSSTTLCLNQKQFQVNVT